MITNSPHLENVILKDTTEDWNIFIVPTHAYLACIQFF